MEDWRVREEGRYTLTHTIGPETHGIPDQATMGPDSLCMHRLQPSPQRARTHPTDPLHHYGGAGRPTHSQPLWWRMHGALRSYRLGTPLPTSAGPAFPGASPCLKHICKSCTCTDRRLVVTRSAHWPPTHSATMVAHADVGSRLQPQWWRMPCGIARHNPILPAICCQSLRGWGGSQGACRYSGLAALLRAGVGMLHYSGAAVPQPQWWRDPVG